MNPSAPVHNPTQTPGLEMRKLGCPVSAEARAHHRDSFRTDLGAGNEVLKGGDVDLMSFGRCEHRGFAGSRTIQHEAAPAFLYESLRKSVAFFFPVIDPAPVHDERSRSFLGKSQMTDDFLALKGNRNPFERYLEIPGSGEVHLARFEI